MVKLYTQTHTYLVCFPKQASPSSFLKCQELCPEESCSQRQVRDQSWDVTQRAITTPRGTAQIPLESAHKFTSTCLIREQFPSFLRKVGFFQVSVHLCPAAKRQTFLSCFLGSVFLEGGVPQGCFCCSEQTHCQRHEGSSPSIP